MSPCKWNIMEPHVLQMFHTVSMLVQWHLCHLCHLCQVHVRLDQMDRAQASLLEKATSCMLRHLLKTELQCWSMLKYVEMVLNAVQLSIFSGAPWSSRDYETVKVLACVILCVCFHLALRINESCCHRWISPQSGRILCEAYFWCAFWGLQDQLLSVEGWVVLLKWRATNRLNGIWYLNLAECGVPTILCNIL